MRFNLLMFLGVFLLTILFSSFIFKKKCERREIAFKIVDEMVVKFEKKYNLQFGGLFQSAPDGIYRTIGLNFSYNGLMTKSEGRLILVDIVTTFLEKINSNESFKKYLRDVPFTGNNVTVQIYPEPNGRPEVYYPDITVFSFYSNELNYEYDTPETYKKSSGFYLTETETFEEAKKLAGK